MPPETSLLASCATASGVLVAVSGGPDSTALLLLVDQWRRQACRPPVYAATVDHGLRPESRAEAETVAVLCRRLGVPHRILVWEGSKPVSRVQERAREARYGLLCRFAEDVGASVLLTAHHADDQYETVLFRLLRGSGIAGLAGMSAETRRSGLIHIRPFLAHPKAALVNFCQSLGEVFFYDALNQDPRFARGRLRRDSADYDRMGLGPNVLLRLSERARRAEDALRQQADHVLDEARLQGDDFCARFALDAIAKAPEEIVLRIICSEASRLSGRPPPRLDRAEKATRALREALSARLPFKATLGGAIIRANSKILELRREIRTSSPEGREEKKRLCHTTATKKTRRGRAHSLVIGGQDA